LLDDPGLLFLAAAHAHDRLRLAFTTILVSVVDYDDESNDHTTGPIIINQAFKSVKTKSKENDAHRHRHRHTHTHTYTHTLIPHHELRDRGGNPHVYAAGALRLR